MFLNSSFCFLTIFFFSVLSYIAFSMSVFFYLSLFCFWDLITLATFLWVSFPWTKSNVCSLLFHYLCLLLLYLSNFSKYILHLFIFALSSVTIFPSLSFIFLILLLLFLLASLYHNITFNFYELFHTLSIFCQVSCFLFLFFYLYFYGALVVFNLDIFP